MAENKRKMGAEAESLAIQYLSGKGCRVTDKNYHFSKAAEVDIIAFDGAVLCFIEVKYRRNLNYGRPEEAVTFAKTRNIIRAAEVYITKKNLHHCDVRFDVVAIFEKARGPEINWIKNAFTR